MKNNITQFSLILIAFVAVNLLMSFARPMAADEPKQYIIVDGTTINKMQQAVDQKIAEGWHVQGGVACTGLYFQAMVK